MKRAGIIIGAVLIVIAILLFVVSKKIEQRNIEKVSQPQQTEVPKVEQPVPTQPEIKVVEKIVEKEVIKSQIVTIEENTLGVGVEKEEVVVIAAKRLILLDEGFGTNNDKMLTYCFDVLTSSNKELTLFMTDVTYRQFEVGNKLKVKYKLYTNNKGVEFPVTVSVNTVE